MTAWPVRRQSGSNLEGSMAALQAGRLSLVNFIEQMRHCVVQFSSRLIEAGRSADLVGVEWKRVPIHRLLMRMVLNLINFKVFSPLKKYRIYPTAYLIY